MATNAPVVARPDSVKAPKRSAERKEELGRAEHARGDWKATARRLWLWPGAVLVSFPIAGYIADVIVNGVDSVGRALVGGLVTGAIIGAAGWFALRKRVSWFWIPATAVGMAVGLTAGAALVDYGIDRGDLLLMGAVTGIGVGALQALVLARDRISGAYWWPVATPLAWALGWLATSYVITANVDERFTIFGLGGALLFALVTWLVLALLFRAAPRSQVDSSLNGRSKAGTRGMRSSREHAIR